MIKEKTNKNIFLLIFIYGLIFRWYGINSGYWYDEWSSFYHSNPSLKTKQIFNNVLFTKDLLAEGAQPLYFIIASKWNSLFGYTPETLRYLSFLCGCLSIVLFFFLLREFSKDSFFIYFAVFLFSSNYFLIQYSQESRYYSLSLLFSLLNLIIFFRFFKKKKYSYYYIISALLSLLLNIFYTLIIFSQLFFLIIKKKKEIIYYISISILVLLYFATDYLYIFSIFQKSLSFNIQNTINFSFLIGYYFNIYFGSILLGGLILFFIFINLKNIKKFNNNILFCIICIFTTYFFPIIYSLVKNPILRPRYIIFIVPIIIIYFTYVTFRIEKKILRNIFISSVVLLSMINNFQFKPIIPKPDTESAINYIYNSNTKFLVVKPEDYLFYDLYYNYLINLQLAKKKKINFIDSNQILNKDFFWSICLNNPRFSSNSSVDDPRCLLNSYYTSHKIFEIKKVSDYILVLYQKYY